MEHLGNLKNLISPLHQATSRDCLARMNDDKIVCMVEAKEYGKNYWDGDRRYGYGGYKYIPGYWTDVAASLIKCYGLEPGSRVLDVGCGKAFLLYELKLQLPELCISGFDISDYGLNHAREDIQPFLFKHHAQSPYPFEDNHFDLVISLGCLHNLRLPDLVKAVNEIERVGRRGFIMVESYRDERELFNLQCWALTAESFFTPDEWKWVYRECGYTGDFEFIFFS